MLRVVGRVLRVHCVPLCDVLYLLSAHLKGPPPPKPTRKISLHPHMYSYICSLPFHWFTYNLYPACLCKLFMCVASSKLILIIRAELHTTELITWVQSCLSPALRDEGQRHIPTCNCGGSHCHLPYAVVVVYIYIIASYTSKDDACSKGAMTSCRCAGVDLETYVYVANRACSLCKLLALLHTYWPTTKW